MDTSSPVSRPIRRWLVAMALMVSLAPTPAGAQGATSTAPALKAAFLYNFARFTEWPQDALAGGQRLSLCVVGDHAAADALEQIIKGRVVEGHTLTVEIIKPDGPVRSCHLLYVSALDSKQSAQLLDTVKGAPVFTVSDAGRFAESGGIAQLISENNRMRFAINVTAADRARLRLSSKLLTLATIIKDAHHDRP